MSVISDDVAEADSAPEKLRSAPVCGGKLLPQSRCGSGTGSLASYTESFTDEFEKFENGEN